MNNEVEILSKTIFRQMRRFDRFFGGIDFDDIFQTIRLTVLENYGEPYYILYSKARKEIYKLKRAYGVFEDKAPFEILDWISNYGSRPISNGAFFDDELIKFAGEILAYYEKHTYRQTIEAFRLPDSHKLRKMLSELVPKGKNAKWGKKYHKVPVGKSETFQSLQKKYPKLHPSAIYRALNRGYFYLETNNKNQ